MKLPRASARGTPTPAVTTVALRAVTIFAAYYAAGRLGLLLALPHNNITPVWPASGIAVASLVLLGRRYWPALLLGSFVLNATTGLPVLAAAALAAGNSCEYVLAAVSLALCGFKPRMERVRDVALLATLGAVFGPLVAATLGTAALWYAGIVPRADLQTVWSAYFLGDGVGILVFASFIFAWSRRPRSLPKRSEVLEGLLLAAVVAGFAATVFLGGLRAAYLIFPLAVTAAIRFRQRGATATTIVVATLAVFGTVHGFGPFQGTTVARLLNLQIYLAAFGLTALSLAAAVAAQRNAERTSLEHLGRLEETNRELEAFAYTVAHDLRAPLRAIDGYSQAIMEDYSADLPDEAMRSLRKIAANAVGMGRLIDTLLDFSRLGSQRVERTTLRPGAVARQVYERLRAGFGARNVEATFAETPPCQADPTLLGLVYQNLISNSLKFVRSGEAVTIEVGWLPAFENPTLPVYYVRDNGIGFDMQYLDKIFGVFQRLHRESEYPGTGAGLAIVKRIVSRHGGAIWAQAEKDRGATFFFTIPEATA